MVIFAVIHQTGLRDDIKKKPIVGRSHKRHALTEAEQAAFVQFVFNLADL